MVWSSKGKNAKTLLAFFEELGPKRCAQIESVSIDMSKAFISAVKQMVPDARLVFDRFYVQRLVQDAMDETRRDEVREARTKEEKKSLKGMRWVLLKNPWNLTDVQDQTLVELEEANRSIFRGYLPKELFASILDRRLINVARDMQLRWIVEASESGLDHFARAARTIELYQEKARRRAWFRSASARGRR